MALSQNAVIILVICGAIGLTLIIGSVFGMFSANDDGNGSFPTPGKDQLDYMAQLRYRHLTALEAGERVSPHRGKPNGNRDLDESTMMG